MAFGYDSPNRWTQIQWVLGGAAFAQHAVLVHLMLPWHYKEDQETYEEWSLIWLTDGGLEVHALATGTA